jgi:hypothetical protein
MDTYITEGSRVTDAASRLVLNRADAVQWLNGGAPTCQPFYSLLPLKWKGKA